MKGLPEKVRIGATTYTIIRTKTYSSSYGSSDYAKQEIEVMEMADEQAWITLWHEIVHVILFCSGYHPKDHDERLVDQIANLLVDAFYKNGQTIIPIEFV